MRHHTSTAPGTASLTRRLSARIDALERELHTLYLQRAGQMEPSQEGGWCARCGRNSVWPSEGQDTCRTCLAELRADRSARRR